MVRFDVNAIRYLEKDHFRVLISVEMGMRNHELVPLQLVASVAGTHRGAVARILSDLMKHRLVAYERGKRADGYRLTTSGYDFLALKALCLRGVVGSIGNQIGVGKESDVFVGGDPDLNDLVLKFHRLGRTSFRKLKEKRDYHQNRKKCNWLYLARLAAYKEFSFLKALHNHKFPVPRPLDVCRHTVVMELIDGVTLCHVHEVKNVGELYDKLMTMIVRLGRYGLIHSDFNEFNIVLDSDGEPILIDFPQMVSIDHLNANFYFSRDVECVRTFFRRRFDFESESYPKFEDVKRKYNLDVEVAASGFTKQMAKDLNAVIDAGKFESSEGEESSLSSLDENEHEDQTEESEKNQKSKKPLTRLDLWLQEAQDQLENLEPYDEEECSSSNFVEDVEQSSTDKKDIVGIDESVDGVIDEKILVNEDLGSENVEAKDDEANEEKLNNRKIAKTTYSVGSTIAREDICRRLALEQRAKNKMKLRIKGKANAVRRERKTNASIIKEYAGWEF